MTRLALLLAVTAACGGDDGTTTKRDAAIDTSNQAADAAIDGPMVDAPPGSVALTVKNVLAWCSVTVNNGTPSTSDSIVVNVQPGVIPLKAKTADENTFKIDTNMWHLTDGDSGSGETGTVTGTGGAAESAVTATVAAMTPKCVWVCCPFLDGSGCNVSNPCP